MKVAIIGAGKVGSVLGKLLVDRGVTISCVVSRSATSARRAGRFLRCPNVSTSTQSIPRRTDLILITTPHAAVEPVTRELAEGEQLNFKRLAVCHASGMLTAKALEPLRRRGAVVFSFHPLQTFPRDFKPAAMVASARGIYFGVDGNRKGVQYARRLAAAIGGKVIIIPPGMRTLYHASCVVASNHLTAMLSILATMFETLRTHEDKFFPVFKPIIMATLKNIESTSPARALSGPVARGGVETVDEHCASVKRLAPGLLPYFLQLTSETVRLAWIKGSISMQQANALNDVVQSYRQPSSRIQERQ